MPLDQKAVVKQIDDVLAKWKNMYQDNSDMVSSYSSMISAIRRLSPPGSTYANVLNKYEEALASRSLIEIGRAIDQAKGILLSLKNDYECGYLQSVVELIHADLFADFLEMADYLLEQGYKDPAAVVTGSVLEAHLRKLCDKHLIPVLKADGNHKKAEGLNTELSAVGAYNLLDQKNVTAWLDLRNKAAHGKYAEYTKDQVVLMLENVRNFVSRIPG